MSLHVVDGIATGIIERAAHRTSSAVTGGVGRGEVVSIERTRNTSGAPAHANGSGVAGEEPAGAGVRASGRPATHGTSPDF